MRKILVADISPPDRIAAATLVVREGAAYSPPKRKILVAAGRLCPGSVAKVLFDTVQGIPDYHFLIWVAPGEERSSGATLRRCWEDLGGEWPENFSFLTSRREAEMLALEIHSTFVHLFTDDSWYMRFSLERGIPIVTFSHSVSYFEDYPLVSSPRAPKVVWQRRAFVLASTIVCWSNLEKEFIGRFLPVVRDKIVVIPLCQRMPPEAQRRRTSPAGHRVEVLFAGRPLATRKGFAYLAAALQQLAGRGYDVHLTVADAFTNAAPLAKRRFSDSLDGVAVRWLRDLEREKMRRAYQSVHVVVVPSLYDSWCKVVTEAIAEGTPVIATDATGATEFFRREEVPRVRAGDSGAIVAALERLLSDYRGSVAATEKARERLRAELTVEKHAARLRRALGME
jgi:glycosyltransferase involved in cell wall biosynthesis